MNYCVIRTTPQPNIAILLPDLRSGGAERVCINLANAFVERGLEVEMVLMRAAGELLPLLDPRIKVVDLGAARVRGVLFPLASYQRKRKPGAMLANMWPLTVIAVLARWLARTETRVVAVEHNTWSMAKLVRRWSTRMSARMSMRLLLPYADAVVGVSRGVADDLARFAWMGRASILAIHNPVVRTEQGAVPPLPQGVEQWAHGSCKRVLAVGSLKEQKNFPLLLHAFARLRTHLDARLMILGEGRLRDELEALVAALRLQSAVFLPGFMVNAAAFYAHADLFVLSSDFEGFGNVIVEALERGAPVVSTDCPSGPREILEDGKYGRLVPVGDVDALAKAMLESLQSTHDHAALKARAQDFSVDRIANQYLDLLLPGRQVRDRSKY